MICNHMHLCHMHLCHMHANSHSGTDACARGRATAETLPRATRDTCVAMSIMCGLSLCCTSCVARRVTKECLVCVCVCMCLCVRVHMCVYMDVCVRANGSEYLCIAFKPAQISAILLSSHHCNALKGNTLQSVETLIDST